MTELQVCMEFTFGIFQEGQTEIQSHGNKVAHEDSYLRSLRVPHLVFKREALVVLLHVLPDLLDLSGCQQRLGSGSPEKLAEPLLRLLVQQTTLK